MLRYYSFSCWLHTDVEITVIGYFKTYGTKSGKLDITVRFQPFAWSIQIAEILRCTRFCEKYKTVSDNLYSKMKSVKQIRPIQYLQRYLSLDQSGKCTDWPCLQSGCWQWNITWPSFFEAYRGLLSSRSKMTQTISLPVFHVWTPSTWSISEPDYLFGYHQMKVAILNIHIWMLLFFSAIHICWVRMTSDCQHEQVSP